MKKIVAIGGGEIGRPGYACTTLPIDKEIIRLSAKKRPKLLFIPTASSDSELYVKTIKKHFGVRLRCTIDVLYLLKNQPSRNFLKKKILGADIIYVGGGNTLKMMNRWRTLGVDKLLKRAYQKGIVLCGVSAGSICWFDSGHSDSMSFYNQKSWQYIAVRGLGMIHAIHCPHFNGHTSNKWRKNDFIAFMKKRTGVGIGIDNDCAIEFIDNKYRVIASKNGAKAYRVFKNHGKICCEEIAAKKGYTPTFMLLKKLYKTKRKTSKKRDLQ